MSKKPSKKAVSAVPAAPEIPKDLQDQLSSIRALAQCYNLLQKGYFPHGFGPAIDQSLQFLQALHGHAMSEAVKHPSASLVPELQQGAPNGQK